MARTVERVLAVFVAVLDLLLGTVWLQYGTEQGTSLFGPGPSDGRCFTYSTSAASSVLSAGRGARTGDGE